MRTPARWVAAGVAVVAVAGCGGAKQVDRTGRATGAKPLTLTLANHENDPTDIGTWAGAVESLSRGSLKIEVSNDWRVDEPDYDEGTIEDVRSGKVPLAKVAARAFDEAGVKSFQPLVAPLLIDNTSLAAQAIGGPIGDRALRGAEQIGLVGLAMFPTELRRPVGITRALRGPQDYRGARMSTREGRITEATLRALGARRAALQADDPLRHVDGAELPPSGLRARTWIAKSGRGAVTGNVVLWPKPIVIVMNRRAFDRLTTLQQDALRGAADVSRAAAAEEQASLSGDWAHLCRLGMKVVSASPTDLKALRAALQPVYDEISRAPGNADALEQIERMKAGTRSEALTCAGVSTMAAKPTADSPLRGTYFHRVTKQELASSPHLLGPGEVNDENWGDMTLRFDPDGTFRFSGHNSVGQGSQSGTYRTDGNKLELDIAETGETFAFRWSLYRGTLKLRRDETLGESPTPLIMKPWQAR